VIATQTTDVSVLSILVIDDDPDHTELFRIATRELEASVELNIQHCGQEALFWLGQAMYDNSQPDIIVLDLNMPEMHGFEVLAELKSDEQLRRIPVIILSCSAAECDVLAAYERGANTYLTKPTDFGRFRSLVHTIVQYWGHNASLSRQY
jgi:CheY-like chemotaxis protein